MTDWLSVRCAFAGSTSVVHHNCIGPGSDLVCGELEDLHPGAVLAVEGRLIHSPTEISVVATVNATPVTLRYDLSGYRWRLNDTRTRIADVTTAQTAPQLGN